MWDSCDKQHGPNWDMSTDTLGPALDSRRVPSGASPPGRPPPRGRPHVSVALRVDLPSASEGPALPTPGAHASGPGAGGRIPRCEPPHLCPLAGQHGEHVAVSPELVSVQNVGTWGGAGSPAPPAPPPGSLPPFTTGAQSCGPVQGTRPGEHSSSAPCPGRGVAPRLPRESAPLDREATGCCQLSATTHAGPAREVGGAGGVQDPSLRTESSLGVNTPAGAVCAPGSHADLGGGRRASGCCAGHRRVVGSKGWAACSRAILQEMRGHYGAARLRPA